MGEENGESLGPLCSVVPFAAPLAQEREKKQNMRLKRLKAVNPTESASAGGQSPTWQTPAATTA